MARKTSARRPAKKQKASAKRKPAKAKRAKRKPPKRKAPRKRDAGVVLITPIRKLAESNARIEALRRHVLEECVALTSSIDTVPAEILQPAIREQWRRELEQAAHALTLVEQHLAPKPEAGA
jgi:hypothetical protein